METLDVVDAIFSTPSVRRVKADAVPDEVIWEMLHAAIQAPSSGNAQRWAWIVVKDASTKEIIGRWYLEAWEGLGVGRRVKARRLLRRVFGDDHFPDPPEPPPDDNDRAGDYLAHNIAKAPVWIFAIQRGIGREPTMVDGADAFGAIQNLMLTARKHGVGCTPTMLHRQHERDVTTLLGLPADARALVLIPIGYPASGAFRTPRRLPVETVTYWERWGQPAARTAAHQLH